MSERFTRRGFVRTAGVGLAAAWLPSLAYAEAALELSPRWVVDASALRVTLHLRGPAGVGVELPANALRLFASMRAGSAASPELELESAGVASQRRSRAGFRLGRRLVIPAGEEVAYDTFAGEWPDSADGEVSVALRAELRPWPGGAPEGDRAALAALAHLSGQVSVTRG